MRPPEVKEKTRGVPVLLDFAAKLTVAVLIVALLPGGLWLWAEWEERRMYAMPPDEFLAQARLISPGMTQDEAIAKVKGYSYITRAEDSTTLFLTARDDFEPILLSHEFYGITLWLGEDGKVKRVTSGDG